MEGTNEWMDETEQLLKSYKIGMDSEEASKLQEKTEVCFKLKIFSWYWVKDAQTSVNK